VLCITNFLPAFVGKAANDTVTAPCWKSVSNKRQQFSHCIMVSLCGDWLQTSINDGRATFSSKTKHDMLAAPAPARGWVSTECQQFLILQLGQCNCRFVELISIWNNGSHFRQQSVWYCHYPIMKLSFNEVSSFVGLAHLVIKASCGYLSL